MLPARVILIALNDAMPPDAFILVVPKSVPALATRVMPVVVDTVLP